LRIRERFVFIALQRHFQTVSCSVTPLTTLYYFCRSFSAFQLPSILHIPTYKCAARGGLQHGERTEQAAFAMPGKVASPSLQTSGIKTVGVQYNDTGGAGSGSGSGNSSANSKDAACSSSSSSSSESGGIRGFFSSLFGFSSSPSTGNISSSSNNSSSSNSSSLQSSNTAPVMRATATTTASYSKNTQTKQLTDKQRAALAKVKAQAQSQSQRDK
jgi:hypothetical protein